MAKTDGPHTILQHGNLREDTTQIFGVKGNSGLENTLYLLMAGGMGTRLWPKSRVDYPKQFIDIFGNQSLLQMSYRRLTKHIPKEDVFVVTLRDFSRIVQEQLPELPSANLLLEPLQKNTAACISMALPYMCRERSNPVVVAIPVDSYISKESSFINCLQTSAQRAASVDGIVVIGIHPTRPETEFGYIRAENCLDPSFYSVGEFTEKPNRRTAMSYLADPLYYWNTGIVIAQTSILREIFGRELPCHANAMAAIEASIGTELETEVRESVYQTLESTSIDYGVLERTSQIYMVEGPFGWDDLGTWNSLGKFFINDSQNGNAFVGPCETVDVTNCIFDAGSTFVVGIGVHNLIVVYFKDVLLICDRDREHDIRTVHYNIVQNAYK